MRTSIKHAELITKNIKHPVARGTLCIFKYAMARNMLISAVSGAITMIMRKNIAAPIPEAALLPATPDRMLRYATIDKTKSTQVVIKSTAGWTFERLLSFFII
jgi:hypothetical protein